MPHIRIILLVSLNALLFACGGGGGSSGGNNNPNPPTPPPPPPPTAQFGIDTRPLNANCIAPTRTTSGGTLGMVNAFPNLPGLNLPMKMVQAPNENNFYVIEREGGIQRFANDPNTSTLTNYLNIAVEIDGEGGLLGIAFDPAWPARPHIYLSYTLDDGSFKSRLSRIVVQNDNSFPVTYNEEVLLEIDQPLSIHNGGDLAFGADQSLYWSLGDGGDNSTSQQTNNWLGSMLRIDVIGVGHPNPGYNIPSTNPFSSNARCSSGANAQDCPEIYAWGFRNPFRWSFDNPTGDLWLGDVGDGALEEVDIVTLGNNYGWRCKEGTLDFNTAGCDLTGLVDPVFEYVNTNPAAITGGYVYRGSRVPELSGRYIYADFLGQVSYLSGDINSGFTGVPIGDAGLIAGFGIDRQGEVYALSFFSFGQVLRFDSNGGTVQDNMPDNLSDTGCVSVANPQQPDPALIPYSPAAPFWSDNADKDRWLALPDGTTIDVESDGDFSFPPGAVLMKNFTVGNQLLETRLFVRHPDGVWAGYTYEWNSAQTSATRVRNGTTVPVGGQNWIIPSESECLICHTDAAGFSLGLETAQLNNDLLYPVSGITDNQLEVYNHIDLFSVDVAEPVSQLSALVDPFDSSADIDSRARAYLHSNCAGCHRPNGPTGTSLDFRFDTALSQTQSCDTAPQGDDLGIANALLIAPGEPNRSVVLSRINRRDSLAMPPLASNVIDAEGVTLMTDWINQLASCI